MKDYKKILRHNLKERRKALGLTQYELAEKLNVEDKYISRLETGTSTPSFALLETLSKVLETDMAALFATEDSSTKEELIKNINKQLARANTEDLKIITKMITGVLQ
ncbi:MAG: helix-turn-helix domain-containing protein [Fusobacterium sp.]|nr:helix-turn-helix domain-containing protein [Fusobacterium sp.]